MRTAPSPRRKPTALAPARRGQLKRPLDDPRAREDQSRAQVDTVAEDQQVVQEWRDRYAALLDAMPVAVVQLSGAGVIEEVNAAALRLLAVAPPRLRGGSFKAFVAAADRPALAAHLRRCRQEAGASTELLLTPLGRAAPLPVELHSAPVGEGRDRYVTAILDVSERKRLEMERAQLTSAEHEAREASRAKDHFIAALSRELRSPLTPVLAAVTAIQTGKLPPAEIAHHCETIHRNVLAEARLIDDLLDVTRIVSGKIRVDCRSVDLHEIASDALESLTGELRSQQHTVTIHLDATWHRVDGDALRLRQVLMNLLRNAVKLTPPRGEISLRSWNRGGNVLIEVSDSGIGIAPQSLQRIFNPFEQAEDAAREGGLGLGLAICKGIVDLHRGTIVASSGGPGQGARFVVELPIGAAADHEATAQPRSPAQRVAPSGPAGAKTGARAKAGAQAKASTRAKTRAPAKAAKKPEAKADARPEARPVEPAATPASADAPRARSPRLLLVEDNAEIAESLAYLLAMEGFEVDTATTARDALGRDLANVDLVISDLGLPDLGGHQLMRLLHKKKNVPGIALSGYGTETDVQDSRAAGFFEHFTKPVDLDVLLDGIRSALATPGAPERPPPRPVLKTAGATRGGRSSSRERR
jgi:PAS domain S-box-containing protein